MTYEYKAYSDNCPDPFDGFRTEDGKTIKELVTVNITIRMEREKYDNKRGKANLAEKIYKLFK